MYQSKERKIKEQYDALRVIEELKEILNTDEINDKSIQISSNNVLLTSSFFIEGKKDEYRATTIIRKHILAAILKTILELEAYINGD